MTPFDIALLVYGAILSVTTVSVVFRMIVGPTILDRAISTDMLVVLLVIGMALYSAQVEADAVWAGPAMLALTGLAFIGTVTFARFVARENPLPGRRQREEPGTSTGPLEAIHFDHDGRTPDPANAYRGEIEAEMQVNGEAGFEPASEEDAEVELEAEYEAESEAEYEAEYEAATDAEAEERDRDEEERR